MPLKRLTFCTFSPHLREIVRPQYLKLARELSGYGDIVFPHCACDSRKEGHVIPAVGTASFKLHAAKEDGTLESQVVEFQWSTIARWEVDEDGMAFCFQYTRQDNRPPRWLKVFTPYVSFPASASYTWSAYKVLGLPLLHRA